MKPRKILGATLISVPFVLLFISATAEHGVVTAAASFIVAGALAVMVGVGVWLADS